MKGMALIGALVGGFAGALIWLGAIAADGSPLGPLALIVGAGVAAGAVLFNSTPQGALPAAIITLLFCLVAKFAGIPLALADNRAEIKTEFEIKQYDLFMADANSLAKLQGADREQFLQGRSPYDADRDGKLDSREREVFDRFWAPRLAQWAVSPPLFEQWKVAMQTDWGQESGETTDAKTVATSFFAPVQLLFLLLAIVGAHQAVARISLEEGRNKRRTQKIAAGVFDLNEDIGSGVDIKVALPGQSARKPAVEPKKEAPKKEAPKKEAPIKEAPKDDKTRFEPKPPNMKPAPKKTDRPPGM